LLTEAIDACRRMTNGDTDEALIAFAEAILQNDEAKTLSQEGCRPSFEPPRDEDGKPNRVLDRAHRPPYQIVVDRCEGCGRVRIEPSGVEAGAEFVERIECDADVVDLTKDGRLSRTIPPRIRRMVMLRDHGRCQVPECTNRLWTECHHARWRSRGGDHSPHNLVVLCSVHHEAVHDGSLIVEREGEGWRWRHRDGREFGVAHVGHSTVETAAAHVGREAEAVGVG